MPVSYSKGKIYKITSSQTESVYIGSTCNSLERRLWSHKKNYDLWKNEKYGYCSSFEIVKFDDSIITVVEEFPSTTKLELHTREGEIIRNTENCINYRIAGRTRDKYRVENKELISKKYKEYRMKNIEERLKKEKEAGNRYREKNKDKINAKKRTKFDCECGGIFTYAGKSCHVKTKKHLHYLNQMEIIESL
jgi:hypothetical protein